MNRVKYGCRSPSSSKFTAFFIELEWRIDV